MTHNGQINTTTNEYVLYVHLEDHPAEDLALFEIRPNGATYEIRPKNATGTYVYLNPYGGNKASLIGSSGNGNGPTGYSNAGGIIGLWSTGDNGSNWYFEPANTIVAPTITNNFDGTVTIAAAEGATIYYTTDGTDPTIYTVTTGTTTVTVSLNGTIAFIKAIAKASGDAFPTVVTTYRVPVCETPVIRVSGDMVNITCTTPNSTIHYTTNDTQATPSSQVYSTAFSFEGIVAVRAMATSLGYFNSGEAFYYAPVTISSSSEITNMNGNYILADGFVSVASIGTQSAPFRGIIDGRMVVLSGLTHPMVDYADGATIKNVVLKDVNISGNGNVGAICNEVSGSARIYNCGVLGGSVTSTDGAAGGLVGHIVSGKVVNCYNYATISGSSYAAGIVGWNEGTVSDGTRIAMCMMYGDITSGATISPVYCGSHVSNNRNYTEYNYWRYRANLNYTDYNDQLAIDKDWFLTRFPFYRHILNTHREMAALFLFGNTTALTTSEAPTEDEIAEIGHWALKEDVAPYPIVEPWETNTHRITQDLANNLPNTSADYAGRLLTEMGNNGNLAVTVKIGTETYSCNLPITDMDTLHYDFTWGKVVLPFANEFSGWTRDYSKVCTGWKITSVTKGGTAYTSFDIPTEEPYNFADRNNPQKDIYDATNNPYVFAQGGNFIVPYE